MYKIIVILISLSIAVFSQAASTSSVQKQDKGDEYGKVMSTINRVVPQILDYVPLLGGKDGGDLFPNAPRKHDFPGVGEYSWTIEKKDGNLRTQLIVTVNKALHGLFLPVPGFVKRRKNLIIQVVKQKYDDKSKVYFNLEAVKYVDYNCDGFRPEKDADRYHINGYTCDELIYIKYVNGGLYNVKEKIKVIDMPQESINSINQSIINFLGLVEKDIEAKKKKFDKYWKNKINKFDEIARKAFSF